MPTVTEEMSIKPEAIRLVEQLPTDATWEDLAYEIRVRQSVEAGLRDCEDGRVIPVEEVRRRLGLSS